MVGAQHVAGPWVVSPATWREADGLRVGRITRGGLQHALPSETLQSRNNRLFREKDGDTPIMCAH